MGCNRCLSPFAVPLLLAMLSACSTLSDTPTRNVIAERLPSGAVLVEGQETEVAPGTWVRDGRWRQYYEDGCLEVEWFWKEGIEQGPWTAFYEDGAVHIYGGLAQGHEDGLWTEYFEDGTKAYEGRYVAGKEDGEWREWHESGVLRSLGTYDHGVPIGSLQEWHENGQLALRAEYGRDGSRVGQPEAWLPDGTPDPLHGRRRLSADRVQELEAALRRAAQDR